MNITTTVTATASLTGSICNTYRLTEDKGGFEPSAFAGGFSPAFAVFEQGTSNGFMADNDFTRLTRVTT